MGAKERSRIAFDYQASRYDDSYYSRDARGCYPYVLEALEELRPQTLLDVGCGTGNILAELAGQQWRPQLCGVDLSPNMLEQAELKLGDAAELVLGDAEDLPFSFSSFDAVTCVESLHHYPNPHTALSEMARVLRPGGLLILCDIWLPAPARTLANLFLPYSGAGDVRIYSMEEMSAMLEAAGFKITTLQVITTRSYGCICQKAAPR